MTRFLLALLMVCAGLAGTGMAGQGTQVSVDGTYGDYMVLQRDRPIHVTGSAEPRSWVAVRIGDSNETRVQTGEDGRWDAVLAAMPAGGPYTVTVTGEDDAEPVDFNDVLIGEVWICSGQSNMDMPVFSGDLLWSIEGYEAILADMPSYGKIRLFDGNLDRTVSPEVPLTQPRGKWTLCSEETVSRFSAVGFTFGRQLLKDLGDVPVGLVLVSRGGSRIEPWISREGHLLAGRTKDLDYVKFVMDYAKSGKLEEEIKRNHEAYRKNITTWMEKFEALNTNGTDYAAGWKDADYDDSDWELLESGKDSFAKWLKGVIWLRKTITIPEDWVNRDLILNLGAVDDCDWTYANGKLVGKVLVDTEEYWSVNRRYTVPASGVTGTSLTIAVRVANLAYGGGLQSPDESLYVAPADDDSQRISLAKDWRMKLEFVADMSKIGGQPVVAGVSHYPANPDLAATLYNAMIHPWIHYPVRGAIWYQGCSNAGNAADYFVLQKMLVDDWRRAWNDPEFAFVITQLTGFAHNLEYDSTDDEWERNAPNENTGFAELREAQWAAARTIDNCGLAVTIDKGEQFFIHARVKAPVGYRLAKEAERICYGLKETTSGPSFKSMRIDGSKAILSFDNVGRGLVASDNNDGVLHSFIISGDGTNFLWANAVICGDTVVVSHPDIALPVAVRYAWVGYAGNLNFFNKDGFPASPFRTDCPYIE